MGTDDDMGLTDDEAAVAALADMRARFPGTRFGPPVRVADDDREEPDPSAASADDQAVCDWLAGELQEAKAARGQAIEVLASVERGVAEACEQRHGPPTTDEFEQLRSAASACRAAVDAEEAAKARFKAGPTPGAVAEFARRPEAGGDMGVL